MENVAPSQDILVKERAESHGTTTRDTSDQPESKEQEQETNAHKKRHKSATKSLCIHLTLFAAFKNPKALYKESEVRQLFLRFLAHREGEVQKLAVKCLMTYKFGYLQPYKENIERLLDDENFRDELAHFSVDEESGIVDTSHREGLMPVLIRSVMTRDILLQVGSGGFSLFRPCAFVFGKLALVVNHVCWSFEMACFLKFTRIYIPWQEKWVFSYLEIFQSNFDERVVACLAVGTERMSYISFSHVRYKC